MSILNNELNIMTTLYVENRFNEYKFNDNIGVSRKIDLLMMFLGKLSNNMLAGSNKNFKLEYYYNGFDFIVDNFIKFYHSGDTVIKQTILNQIALSQILQKISNLKKGQVLLYKLDKLIDKVIKMGAIQVDVYILVSAKCGTFMTFLYWLNKTPGKKIECLDINVQENIVQLSIANSDDRLFKHILERIIYGDSIFLQHKPQTINLMIHSLASSTVPPKYILKRLKLLSQHVSLVPYFGSMVESFKSAKVLIDIHRFYYNFSHSFSTLISLANSLVSWVGWDGEIDDSNVIRIHEILKTDEEKASLDIVMCMRYNKLRSVNITLLNSIVLENYIEILNYIQWDMFLESINTNETNRNILRALTSRNLITEYFYTCIPGVNITATDVVLYTRFLRIGPENIVTIGNVNYEYIIKCNLALHYLRMFIKRRVKTNRILHNVKHFNLLNEIKTFKPIKSKPVLKLGSNVYQQTIQRFNNLPPRHLLPGEIYTYDNFLLSEKADGILVNNLPIGMYPETTILKNYQVKAEYIETLDLYLVFDIDIPNTTIEERYNILRKSHSYTANLNYLTEEVNTFKSFIDTFIDERKNICKFLRENTSQVIKWYPKFTLKYNIKDNQFYSELISIITETNSFTKDLVNMEPYGCDGLILTPLNKKREIKIKPKSLISIDLLNVNGRWLDRNNNNWSHIVMPCTKSIQNNRIYRCYPKVINDKIKFAVGENRYDKKNPNTNHVIDTIINILGYNWNLDMTCHSENHYYDTSRCLKSKKLISMINLQNELLENQVQQLNPTINKRWLDLGCGKGKLISIIKKFNPKYYLGLDIDIKQLVKCLKYYNENQDTYNFSPCNLSTDWNDTYNKWITVSGKFDYIIANFSLMHFCSDQFWEQLNGVSHSETKFLFNLLMPQNDFYWSDSASYLRVENNKVVYRFEWTHNEEKTEPYITETLITGYLEKYKWKVLNRYILDSKHSLVNQYNWFTVLKES